MKTKTKLTTACIVAGAMMWLNILSHPLGISEGVQWVLILGVFIPLGLIFVYNKRLKKEKTEAVAAGTLPASKIVDHQNKGRKRLIVIWICLVPFALSFPFWLPSISGISLGRVGDFMVSIASIAMFSLIFWIQLKKLPNKPPQTPISGTPAASAPVAPPPGDADR